MRTLVHLTGEFSINKLDEIVSKVKILAKQPKLKIDYIFNDKDPEFSHRQISVYYINGTVRYQIMDIGRVRNSPMEVSLASEIYFEHEILF